MVRQGTAVVVEVIVDSRETTIVSGWPSLGSSEGAAVTLE